MNPEDIKKLKKARRLINEVLRGCGVPDDDVETQDDEPGGGGGGPGSEGGGG